MTTTSKRAKRRASEHHGIHPRTSADATEQRARTTRPLAAVGDEPGQSFQPAPGTTDADIEPTTVLPNADGREESRTTLSAPSEPEARLTLELTTPLADAAPPGTNAAPLADAFEESFGRAEDELGDEYPDADEIPDELDEWTAADQPTVVLSPQAFKRRRPASLETGEQQSWPPTSRHGTLGNVTPPIGLRGSDIASARPSELNGPRLAAPDGRRVPDPTPAGEAHTALSNPRMHRFQELRRQRVGHQQGEHSPDGGTPVADVVRQWWTDLRPGLHKALHYQHEARASGLHPIPAHEPAPKSPLGDAFGYLATSARELAERASNVAGPRLRGLHDRAERAAQALIHKVEGNEVRQQGPLLGPGRIAVFFRPAVTVGQAQRLLSATQARPMRIIPRKHGFLAWVKPGTERDVSERLRKHPYVHDVAYLDYDVYGDPVDPTEAEPEQP